MLIKLKMPFSTTEQILHKHNYSLLCNKNRRGEDDYVYSYAHTFKYKLIGFFSQISNLSRR